MKLFGVKFPALRLAITLLGVVAGSVVAHAQFNPIGFEGTTIYNIPYATNVGIPNGTPVNTPFSYTFVSGNNLQAFRNSSAGIVDSDDGSGGSEAVPDYFKSPEFGWKVDGWQTTNSTSATWNAFDSGYIGNGNGTGTAYPGNGAPASEWGESFNVNHLFSPAAGNLAKAPGLGDQFLDMHGSTGFTTQLSLQFLATQTDTFFITLAFGGRDSNSQNYKGYFRLRDITNNTVVFSGDTSQTPFEAWTPTDPNNPSLGAVAATPTNNTGVNQKDWEYFKQTFNVTAGTMYSLELLLPEEHNFDMALGSQYSYTPGIQTNFSVVPEPSTYGMMGLAVVGVVIALQRRSKKKATAVIAANSTKS
ncbi:PEP-CTERM sorting domain-containing protein [Oleiharenicola lentus]|uniref:PEP-CTERM sorting domain-containing protein n=1 Tax=Oleiharenicola lentus TaxID=2508720 RepID=UPI003F664B0F